MTIQRQVILEEVQKTDSHPTADEIYEKVRKRMPRISMGTVYRNLDMLAACGVIQKVDAGLAQMRFDGNNQEHYHLTCVQCGAIKDIPIEIPNNSLENLEKVMGNLTKYGIFGHKLEFFGLCPECLKKGHVYPEDIS
jgi:Fe2+ or Zn2+ uptake regulation protein